MILSGKTGLTLAAALILAKDEIIFNAMPHHKTDALLRVENLDRNYDLKVARERISNADQADKRCCGSVGIS